MREFESREVQESRSTSVEPKARDVHVDELSWARAAVSAAAGHLSHAPERLEQATKRAAVGAEEIRDKVVEVGREQGTQTAEMTGHVVHTAVELVGPLREAAVTAAVVAIELTGGAQGSLPDEFRTDAGDPTTSSRVIDYRSALTHLVDTATTDVAQSRNSGQEALEQLADGLLRHQEEEVRRSSHRPARGRSLGGRP